MRTSVLLRRLVSQRLSPLRAAFPSFVRTATISPLEPRSRRLFKAPRRSIPERVPSKRALALHQGSTRTTDLIVRVRLRRTVFNRDFFRAEPSASPADWTLPARPIAAPANLTARADDREGCVSPTSANHPTARAPCGSFDSLLCGEERFNTVDAVTLASAVALAISSTETSNPPLRSRADRES